MKKSLFAVAAAGAFAGVAGTAAAQSSVTVYGLLDLAYVGGNSYSASGGTANLAPSRTTNSGFGNSAESTSRLGFRGTEDIGGGLSAFFTIEMGITPNGQQVVNSGATQNRQTFLGLKKAGVGQASIGTQYTTLHDAAAVTDPGQLNNMMGNLIYSNTVTTTAATGEAAGLSYTIRANNMLKLNTENISGFKGNAFYVLNNVSSSQTQDPSATNVTGGKNDSWGWGIGVDYTWKALAVTANYQAFNAKNPYLSNGVGGTPSATVSSTATVGTGVLTSLPAGGTPYYTGTGQGSALGQNSNSQQQYYAATYDFGILKGYVQYINSKYVNALYTNNYIGRSAQQIGVRSFITPTVEGWLSGGTGKYNAYGSGGPSNNLVGWQIGGNYFLSKRTNLYAIYGAYATGNATVYANQGYQKSTLGGAAGNTASANANNYAVGVRHTF